MNRELVDALRQGDTKQVMKIMNKSGVAESQLVQLLTEDDFANSIVAVCDYVTSAIGVVNKEDINWTTMFNTARLKVGIEDIRANPAIVIYTQTMMMLLYVLLQDDEED